MKRHNTIAAGVIGCFFAFGIAAQASAALITVDGPITDSMLLNADATATPSFGQALAITFTLDQDATNVSFTAAIDCSFCLGQIFLNRGIAGLGVESADLLAIGDFDSSTNTLFETGANSVLDFGGSTTFDLAAGTYSFGLIVTDDQASWFTSDMSTLTQAAGAACNFGQFAADANPTLPPQNNFTGASSILCGSGDALLFSIDGDFVLANGPQEVPAPAAIVFMATGLAAGGGWLRRRRRSNAALAKS